MRGFIHHHSHSQGQVENALRLTMLIALMAAVTWGAPTLLLAEEDYALDVPLGLDEDSAIIPKDNPLTREKTKLGTLLFFDKRLSQNNTVACASCHKPELAVTDGQPVSMGIHRQQGTRSAPIAINRLFSSAQFWDGRAATLEEQSVGPFISPVEHGFLNHDQMMNKLRRIEGYRPLFKKAFGTDTMTIAHVGKAIASFQRTLLSGNSPFDRFDMGGRRRQCLPLPSGA